jgi:RimJ/RimL family protein N-acetyltransferase
MTADGPTVMEGRRIAFGRGRVPLSRRSRTEGGVGHGADSLERWRPPAAPGPECLDGQRVRLEPLSAAHAAELHAANLADGAIWDHLPYGPFADLASYRGWVERVAGRPDPLFFAAIDLADGRPGGVMSLMRIAPEAGSIEVGHICLARRMQRSTAASEAIFLLAERVFGAGYRRFEWKCDARNRASRRAAQRFGFSYEGVFRNHMVVKGRNRDTAWFAMTDGDWPCLRAAWGAWLTPDNFDAEGRQLARLGDLTSPCRVAADPGQQA